MKFVNRKEELKQLEEYYRLSSKRQIITAVSGLRRVGKTTLVREFIKDKKALYFFVYENKTSSELLKEFVKELREKKLISELEEIDSWNTFFKILFKRCKKYVVVFDEFQNFYNIEKSVFSVIQRNVDENQSIPIHFIFLGSLVRLFKKIFEDNKQPLYGRVSSKINLSPFSLKDSLYTLKLLGHSDLKEMLKIYGVFGGFPKYYADIEKFDLGKKSYLEIIDYLFVQENAPLENEVLDILKQEFGRRGSLYYSILSAIASGKTKLDEIANFTGTKESSITRHLSELEDKFGLITSFKPLNNKKNTRYFIYPPLISFWFKFIYDKFSKYKIGEEKEILSNIKKHFNSFFGRRFEEICKEILVELNKENKLPFRIDYLSNWWGTKRIEGKREEIEIDLIGKNDKSKNILLVECKWKEKVNPLKIVKDLNEKSEYIKHKKKKKHFIIFSKSFSRKIKEFEGKKVYCFDLKDIEKLSF